MKVLFFVDTHANMEFINEIIRKSEKAELLVCAGDLSKMGMGFGESVEKLNSIGKKILIIVNWKPKTCPKGISHSRRTRKASLSIRCSVLISRALPASPSPIPTSVCFTRYATSWNSWRPWSNRKPRMRK